MVRFTSRLRIQTSTVFVAASGAVLLDAIGNILDVRAFLQVSLVAADRIVAGVTNNGAGTTAESQPKRDAMCSVMGLSTILCRGEFSVAVFINAEFPRPARVWSSVGVDVLPESDDISRGEHLLFVQNHDAGANVGSALFERPFW